MNEIKNNEMYLQSICTHKLDGKPEIYEVTTRAIGNHGYMCKVCGLFLNRNTVFNLLKEVQKDD